MTWIDYVIVSMIVFSALISFKWGFIREVLSLAIWGCAFYISGHFYKHLAAYLTGFENELIRHSIAIGILFIATLVVGAIVNSVISSLIICTGLSGTDRVFGIFFGVLLGVFIVSIILFFLDTFTGLAQSADWKDSLFIPKFSEIIKWLFNYLQNTSSFLPNQLKSN